MATSEIMSLEDQALINLTLSTREKIVNSMTKNGTLPSTNEDRAFLLSALDGIDRTVLSKAKIKSDDSNAKTESEIAKNVASVLLRLESKRTINNRNNSIDAVTLPVIDIVEGETFIGVQPVKYVDIMGPDN